MSKGVIVLNKKEVPIIQVGVTNRVRKVTAADHFVGWLVGWFCCSTSQVNSYGHCGTVSSPNHTFFLGRLEQAVNQ